MSSDTINKVAFIEGQGEIPEIETADITMNLAKFFTIDRGLSEVNRVSLTNILQLLLPVLKKMFNESDKLVLDQYIMNGGKVMWLIDEVAVNSDSLVLW